MSFQVGDTFTYIRTFTTTDVNAFAEAAQDFGEHHVRPDAQGRLMVHGLHTASLATKIGGDINFLARGMTFEFLAPVYTGDTITCVARVGEAEDRGSRWRYTISFTFTNQEGAVVATGHTQGVVFNK